MNRFAISCILMGVVLILGVAFAHADYPKALYVCDNFVNPYTFDLLNNDFDVTLSFNTIPSNMSAYDLVVVESYAACSRATADYLKAYVGSGGGVYLNQGTPYFLAESYSLSYIAEWFGANQYHNLGAGDISHTLSVGNPFETGLPEGVLLYRFLDSWAGAAAVLDLEPESQVYSYWNDGSVAAFTHSYGSGRVFYYVQGASWPKPTSPARWREQFPEIDTFLEGGWRWAAQLTITPAVTITLVPDDTTVARGDTLKITATVTNNTDIGRGCHFWTEVYLANGNPYAKNPVLGPEWVALDPSETKEIFISHRIPKSAPLQSFGYWGKVGMWQRQACHINTFGFRVIDSTFAALKYK